MGEARLYPITYLDPRLSLSHICASEFTSRIARGMMPFVEKSVA